eukprot:scaffold196_cov371-Prasinococcus_capsulatus_cf.AAC.23
MNAVAVCGLQLYRCFNRILACEARTLCCSCGRTAWFVVRERLGVLFAQVWRNDIHVLLHRHVAAGQFLRQAARKQKGRGAVLEALLFSSFTLAHSSTTLLLLFPDGSPYSVSPGHSGEGAHCASTVQGDRGVRASPIHDDQSSH